MYLYVFGEKKVAKIKNMKYMQIHCRYMRIHVNTLKPKTLGKKLDKKHEKTYKNIKKHEKTFWIHENTYKNMKKHEKTYALY